MTYLPHTDDDVREMLARIGAGGVKELFEAVPEAVRYPEMPLPEPLSELEMMAELQAMSERNRDLVHTPSFLGGGAYRHFVPSIVDHVISRSEFYTAYTPYQPEISQGTLQAIFEFQSMICALTGMEAANASHYDGATATAEAATMAIAAARGRKTRLVVSAGVYPEYRETLRTYLQGSGAEIVGDDRGMPLDELAQLVDAKTACLIVQSPDFGGVVQDLTGVAETVHASKALLVVVADPIALGMIKPPGDYDADIVVGEGQSLGNSLGYGGPYLGFFATRKRLVRRMAGRLAGETVDLDGNRGYVLTLSTREQHIRREKATSNICTNQGLNALAATVYLATLGKNGLRKVAEICYHRAHYAAAQIDALDGYSVDMTQPFFKEFVVQCPVPAAAVNERLLNEHGILGGLDLARFGSSTNEMLICVTEMNPKQEIDALVSALAEVAS